MTVTSKSEVFNPETLADTVRGQLAQKNAFMGSVLVAQGAVVVNDSFDVADPNRIGTTVTIPYFGSLGKFAARTDGVAATPAQLKQTSETASVACSTLSFEVSRWAQFGGTRDIDAYDEASKQVVDDATREMDDQIVASAAASPLVTDIYSATVPGYLDYDALVDAKSMWGDEQEDIVAMIVHSRTKADLFKLKDSTGRPLLMMSQNDGDFDRFCGIPLVTSDKSPLTGSSMGAVTSTGTTPPVATLAGTPLGTWKLKIKCMLSHASDTLIQFSTDGGNTYSASIAAKDDGVAVPLIDTAIDSLVGYNGTTGLTVAFAAGTFNSDNVWTATALVKARTMILKKNAASFWFNRQALQLLTDKNILADTSIAAMHLYYAAKAYRRVAGGTKPGVVAITHNVRGFIG